MQNSFIFSVHFALKKPLSSGFELPMWMPTQSPAPAFGKPFFHFASGPIISLSGHHTYLLHAADHLPLLQYLTPVDGFDSETLEIKNLA
jgi:hypothetical protein